MAFAALHRSFTLSGESIDIVSIQIMETLQAFHVDKRVLYRVRLSIEEVLLAWQDALSSETTCEIKIRRRLGKPVITLVTVGKKIDPRAHAEDTSEEDDDARESVLNLLGFSPTYYYENGKNVVVFHVAKKRKNPILLLALAISAAVLLGLLGRNLPGELVSSISSEFISPIFTTFLRALSAIAGPMMFLSVVWGIYNIGDTASLGRIGKKMIGRFFAVLFSVSLLVTFINAGMYNVSAMAGDTSGQSIFGDILGMLLAVVPSTAFEPFNTGNALQIVFLAICIGLAMLLLAKKATALAQVVEQSNYVVQLLMDVIASLVPLFIFLSILNIILSGNLSTLYDALSFFIPYLCTIIGICALFAISFGARCKVNPFTVLKKVGATFIIAITTASSSAAFSTNIEDCTKRLGIDAKLANFGVPLGMVMFKIGNATRSIILALFMANHFNVPITISFLVSTLLISAILSVASPPIPGGSLTIFTILFAQLGIPYEAVALATMINVILDFPLTASNPFCLQMELGVVAGKLDMLDKNTLKAHGRKAKEAR